MKLEPYFHIGWNELVMSISKETNSSIQEIEDTLCYWLNIDNPHLYRVTQLVHICYAEMLKSDVEIMRKAVELIQKDNCNVLGYTEVFCIEI